MDEISRLKFEIGRSVNLLRCIADAPAPTELDQHYARVLQRALISKRRTLLQLERRAMSLRLPCKADIAADKASAKFNLALKLQDGRD